MFLINSKSRLAYEGEQKRIADSIAELKPKADTNTLNINAAKADTNTLIKNIVINKAPINPNPIRVFLSIPMLYNLSGQR